MRNWYTTVGGVNGALIDQARAWHQQYDGFSTQNGFVENRAVISTGLMTIGGVDVAPGPDADGDVSAIIRMVDGDVTVPARSASQGTLGTHSPLGDPVHVQATCRISHMDLGGDPKVTEPYTDYLLRGRTPRKTEGACKADGRTVRITKQELEPQPALRGDPRRPDPARGLRRRSVRWWRCPVRRSPWWTTTVRWTSRWARACRWRSRSTATVRRWRQDVHDVPGQARLTTTPGGAMQITADGQPVAADGGQPGPAPDPTAARLPFPPRAGPGPRAARPRPAARHPRPPARPRRPAA